MRSEDQNTSGIAGPVLLAAAMTLLSVLGAVDLVRAVAALGPGVGDVITFESGQGAALDMDARLDVVRTDQTACQLDVAAIGRAGGSLVVEQRQPGQPRLYQAHWSGPGTSPNGADCGQSADLLLKDADMEVLAMAAGGYGLERKTAVMTGVWGSDAIPVR